MAPLKINKYIVAEIATPTFIGMLIFTMLVLMGRMIKLVEMVLNKGVPFFEISLLFLYMMPAFMVITLPLAFLMGILMAFGRLSADAEVIALKASGVSLQQMLKPVFFVAVLTAALTAFLSIYAAPASNNAFRSKIYDIASQKADVGIEPQIFNDDFDGLVLFANEMDQKSGVIDGIFIADERTASTPSIITARYGRILSDPDDLSLALHLEDGSIHRKSTLDEKESYQVIDFSVYDINLDIGQQLSPQGERRKKEKELSLNELLSLRNKTGDNKKRQALSVELVHRFALPFSPLVFALVGVPLGIQTTRSGRGGGFALGLLVFLVY
nr:LPS export ABC transporter permease LptF [Nitrospinaceae bacterium]NIR57781.1 LPS export ABC transporter permease LptF [Nitrospinaceae bacterium]NIS88243.1 LPS export ABC transporter permease LptF [Nitrospinaceae bacterium]NIU47280.1 LPS export ABC transporter permease LptF [Nitrospinaceae bacterium]NIW08844.1 LPS export ABC transporter permease LptF [Nitrospinaceae bacterium]